MRRYSHVKTAFNVKTAFIGLAFSAAVLYALTVAATWPGWGRQARTLDVGAGTLAGTLAGICWAVKSRQDSERYWQSLMDAAKRDRTMLITTLAGVAPAPRREMAKTRPFRVL